MTWKQLTSNALLGGLGNVGIDHPLNVDLPSRQGQVRRRSVVDVMRGGAILSALFAALGLIALVRTGRVGFDHHRVGLLQQGQVYET